MLTTETTSMAVIIPESETTTPPPEWSPPTIAGGIEETFLLFGQPENASPREIGTLNDGRRIDWTAYREAIRGLYGQPYAGAVPAEEFSLRIHAIDAQFGLEPMEPVQDGDVEDAPPSILDGGVAAGGLHTLNILAGAGNERSLPPRTPRALRNAAGVLMIAGLVLAACSPFASSSGGPGPTEQPGITQPADSNASTPPAEMVTVTPLPIPPTPEATATTPPQEFACWVPGGEDEVNHLAWNDTIEAQMAALAAEEESCLSDWGITAESISQLNTGKQVEYNSLFPYAPYQHLQIFFGRRDGAPTFIITSANKVLMPSGSENWAIGLATKREGGKLGKLHFMIDRNGLKYYVEKVPHETLWPEEGSDADMLAFLNDSDRLKYGFTVEPFIAYPGGPEYPENFVSWKDSDSLIRAQFIGNKGFVDSAGEAAGTGMNAWALAPSLAPNHRINTPEWEEDYLDWAETKIFPVRHFRVAIQKTP